MRKATQRSTLGQRFFTAIVDKALWDEVQALLVENLVKRAATDTDSCRQEGDALSILRIEVSHYRDSQGPVKGTADPGGQS